MEILIRKAKKGDSKKIAQLMEEGLNNGFNKYTGTNIPFSKKKIKEMDEKFSKDEKNSCVIIALDKERDRIIGHCNFSGKKEGRTRHRVELGWIVHKDYIKKGIATKMIKRLIEEAKKRGIKRLEAEAAVINKASLKLAKKQGFKIEGKKVKGLLLDNGRYVDTHIFGKILD